MPTAIYGDVASPKTILASGGDATITFASITTNAGRLSGRLDLGAWPRPILWRWWAKCQMQATPTALRCVSLHYAMWDDESTPGRPQGDVGASDAAFNTKNDLANLTHFGDIICDAASAAVDFVGMGFVELRSRYISLVAWNDMNATSSATASTFEFRLTPQFDELQ